MPIWRRLRRLDWTALIAELVLIFVGITAALWFDNLNQERADRRLEREVLSQLAVALRSDTADLNANLASSGRTTAAIDTVLAYLDDRRPYDSTLAARFARTSIHTNFLGDESAYEFLKSIGLDIIRDDSLRIAVTQYYEYNVGYLKAVEQVYVNENFNGSMRPGMLQRFSYNFLYGPAVPHNYRALLDDAEYRSLLTTPKALLRFKDMRTLSAVRRAEELLANIGVALDRPGSS